MSGRGRPRDPKIIKLQRGTYRKDRNPEREPEPERLADVPKPPAYLNTPAKRLWKDLAPRLIAQGVLTTSDLSTFELLCQAYGQYRDCYDAIYRPKVPVEDPETGRVVMRRRRQSFAEYADGRNSQTMPEYTALKAAHASFKLYAAEFGLSPASRNRINIANPGEEVDPMEKLLNEA